MANCDVFISYRQAKGRDIARCLQLALAARGANCFIDLHGVRKGKSNEKIYSVIEHAKYFVLLITKGTLDGCFESDDWLRKEIEHALEARVPIVPVVPSGHPKLFSDRPLPKSIGEIGKMQISELNLDEDFESDVDRLMEERLGDIVRRKGASDAVQKREQSFLSAAQRYKSNDGKIDEAERAQLEELANELSIGTIRREALIEQVEAQYEMAQKAAQVFLAAARRHKYDDGVIDDEERADLEKLADRLALDRVRREELVQSVEREYDDILKRSAGLRKAKASDRGGDISFNSAKGEFEVTGDVVAPVLPTEESGDEERFTVISDVLSARFGSLPKDEKLFVADIPIKKRAKAWRALNVRESEESIRLLVDNTLFGSAAEGLVVTGEAVYFKNLMENPVRIRLDKVEDVLPLKGDKISISGYGFECHFLANVTKRKLCKALDGLGAELAQKGVAFEDDAAAVDAVIGCFPGIKNNMDVYLGDNIPDKKRMNAHRALRVREPLADICVLADATVFGGAEEGLVVTPKAVYFRNSFESPNRIPFEEIRRVEVLKKDLAINGLKFTSIGGNLEKAAPLLAKGLRSLARKNRMTAKT